MNSTEAYANGDRVAWNHPENPYGNRPFDDTLLNKDTFDSKFYGTIVVKPNKRSSAKGAGAVIACFRGGQIAFGAPEASTRSNGEVLLCENLAMASAAAREALHGTTILKQVTTELNERMQATLIEAGLLRAGGTVAAITKRELRANTPAQVRALAAVLAARGFACMAGGELILFLAKNDAMVEGEVLKMPRSLGNGVHGLESLQPKQWGRFRRFGPDLKVPTTSELVEAVKKERATNSAKGGACAQPNPSPIRVPNPSSHSPCLCVPTHAMCLRSQEDHGRARGPQERHRRQGPEDDSREDGQGPCVRPAQPQPNPSAQSLLSLTLPVCADSRDVPSQSRRSRTRRRPPRTAPPTRSRRR